MHFSKVAFSATLLAAAVSARPVVSIADYRQLERSASAASSSFALQNGQDAQALNRMFQDLTTSSSCNSGQQACVKDKFAQCVDGKFVISACGPTLQCVALPLVNKRGTSVTCDTKQDAETRIANTGAKGGLTGITGSSGKRENVVRANPTAPPACEAKQNSSPSRRGIKTLLLKRIAQTDLGQVAQSWQTLCAASGGPRPANDDPCVVLAGINGTNALLAGADACAQQDNADAMVDFAKLPGIKNKQALIDNAVAYRQHPRNALNINGVVPSTLFCEKAPRNPELKNVVNAQLAGVNRGLFGSPNTPIEAFGAPGTCPFGQTADVATCTCH